MERLLLATRNRGKIREIQEILSDLNIEIKTLLDAPDLPAIVEDRNTLEENALRKARFAFERTKLPTLADDSGLEVFALNGAPGVFSARYAGEGATYDDNNRKLLAALKDFPSEKRRAQFRCVISFVAPGVEKLAQGSCAGTITEKPRGSEGFGYDPLFVPDGFEKTLAELPLDVKNRISHRGLALLAIKDFLRAYFRKSS